MNPIFPGLPLELNDNIYSYCDTKSLTQLSGVTTGAKDHLSNGVFFKDRFYSQHPDLKPYDLVFSIFRSRHPDNCWKVICRIMDPAYSRGNFPERFQFSFVDKAVSQETASLMSQKQELEEKIKQICGEYYADLRSPIDKAWKECDKYQLYYAALRQEIIQLNEQIGGVVNQLKTLHSAARVRIIRSELSRNATDFQEISEEEFMKKTEGQRKGMLIEHLPFYRDYARMCLKSGEQNDELSMLRAKMAPLRKNYAHLESLRQNHENKINFLNQEISSYQSDPCGRYKQVVRDACLQEKRLENALKSEPRLKECEQLIQKTIVDPSQLTPETLAHIRQLINACPHEVKKEIWEELYFTRANGIIEDEWSEKHFQDFLPSLLLIVKDKILFDRKIIRGAR